MGVVSLVCYLHRGLIMRLCLRSRCGHSLHCWKTEVRVLNALGFDQIWHNARKLPWGLFKSDTRWGNCNSADFYFTLNCYKPTGIIPQGTHGSFLAWCQIWWNPSAFNTRISVLIFMKMTHTYITVCIAHCVNSTEYMSNQRRCRQSLGSQLLASKVISFQVALKAVQWRRLSDRKR